MLFTAVVVVPSRPAVADARPLLTSLLLSADPPA